MNEAKGIIDDRFIINVTIDHLPYPERYPLIGHYEWSWSFLFLKRP